jgi:glycerol uptake facilitator protein
MFDVFISETAGTALLVLLGCGVVANVALTQSKGFGGGWLLINFGWGLAVFAGVYASATSGAHLNPAVTLGMLVSRDEFAPGVSATVPHFLLYLSAQLAGAALGAVGTYLAYKKHFDAESDSATILGVFATGPAIRTPGWNVVTEALGTFVLVYVVLFFGQTPSGLGPLAVAMLVVGIGASLGGPTGYAINPARDIAPRVVHALLPMAKKGGSDWGYAWVPVVGPLLGGLIAGGLYGLVSAA